MQLANKNVLVYDCEIRNCIPSGEVKPNLRYCKGWHDYEGMEISVICCYSNWNDTYNVYLRDNLSKFQELVDKADEVVGFNSIAFDDKLCAANNIQIRTTYDLLCQVRKAVSTTGKSRGGYSLDKLAIANFSYGKTGSGALAPELWQQGKYGEVINYCLQDVAITRKLYERRLQLVDPTNNSVLTLAA